LEIEDEGRIFTELRDFHPEYILLFARGNIDQSGFRRDLPYLIEGLALNDNITEHFCI